jgi:hypothetical protein
MRRTPTSLAPALVCVALVALLSLSGCAQAEEAAKGAASDAACSVARSAADEAARQAGRAIDDLGADPQSAEQELRGVRDAVAAAEKGVDGDVRDDLADARAAVERLLGQAQGAARGVEVDTGAVEAAKADLDRAVADVTTLC